MIKKPKTDPVSCTANITSLLDALDILGGKWRLLIVHYLMVRRNEQNTFKKIEKDIGTISAKVLSNELKILEINHIVTRTVLPTKPISVKYSITDYGLLVQPIIELLVNWGKGHRYRSFETEQF